MIGTMAMRRTLSARARATFAVVVALCIAASAFAQFRRFRSGTLHVELPPNAPYNGRFTFVRMKYTTLPGGYWYQGLPAWMHGYPIADGNLMKIMNEVTDLGARDDDINVVSWDDPEIFKYPVAYVIEVGWWDMNDAEANALRRYLLKGGFVIVDDFKIQGGIGGGGWDVFERNMKRALPTVRFFDMDPSHPIFHSFFEINRLDNFPQAYNAGRPVFRGVYEDNDPRKRLQMIINYNTDISQFWEWSGRGFRPVDETNEAYKLGVNAILYGMLH